MGRRITWKTDEKEMNVSMYLNGELINTYGSREYPQETRDKCTLHGIKQKLADCMSSFTKAERDNMEDEDILAAYDAMHQRLKDGEWTIKAEGGGTIGKAKLVAGLVAKGVMSKEDAEAFVDNIKKG